MNNKDAIINQRIHLGSGRYYEAGLCKNIKVGDTVNRGLKTLEVMEVILIRDAKANNWTE